MSFMLRHVVYGFITTTIIIWLCAYARLSFLQDQSSKTAEAIAVFARSYGQTTGILPWREVLLSFNATHPLLTSTSHEAGVGSSSHFSCSST